MEPLEQLNNLESLKWLLWKTAPEGTYLTVIPENVPKEWNINSIKNVLIKSRILNFNLAKIETAIKAASGQMELIGPPFESFEEGKRRYLHLQVTPIQVRFAIDISILKTDFRITVADVLFILAEKAVSYGIDLSAIEEILSSEIYGQEFVIASATMPISGKDATITEVIPIDPDAKPFLNENDTVDYKKWDNIRQIKKEDVICIRTPPTPGIPGISVFGLPLSPPPGEDYALPQGLNTKAIDNETKLVANITGFLYRDGRNICIGGLYIVRGDVDFKTGNIDYYGDVLIRGNVNAGFSVIADGNISIEGFAESAHIESKNGNVSIKGSAFGLNNGIIIANKNISTNNIQDTKIKAGKILSVKGHIRNCQIETENLEMMSNGQILGSTVLFRGNLKCGCIGGKTETLNEFVFVENERDQLKEELQKLNELLQKLDKAIALLNSKIFSLEPSNRTPELENQKKLFMSQLRACNDSKELMVEKRKKLLRLIEFMPNKEELIKAYTLSPVLKVSIFGSTREYKQELSHFKISWRAGGIKMESI
jgi:uncharacterized protein (DUF342 family)